MIQDIPIEVAPCPFCGCKNVYPVPPSLGNSEWRVFCDDCHAQGPTVRFYNTDELDEVCIRAWNLRR